MIDVAEVAAVDAEAAVEAPGVATGAAVIVVDSEVEEPLETAEGTSVLEAVSEVVTTSEVPSKAINPVEICEKCVGTT